MISGFCRGHSRSVARRSSFANSSKIDCESPTPRFGVSGEFSCFELTMERIGQGTRTNASKFFKDLSWPRQDSRDCPEILRKNPP